MAKTETKKVSKIKIKKKVWYPILSPKLFGQKEVGENYLTSADTAIGRQLQVNLRDLTGNVKDQNVYLHFQISRLEGNTLHTEVIGYFLTPAHVKRLVRKNSNRLDDYFLFTDRNGRKLVVKTLMITANKAQRSACSLLRKQLKELLSTEIGKSDVDTFVGDLVNRKVLGLMRKTLSKVHPLKEVAIRVLKVKA